MCVCYLLSNLLGKGRLDDSDETAGESEFEFPTDWNDLDLYDFLPNKSVKGSAEKTSESLVELLSSEWSGEVACFKSGKISKEFEVLD